MPVKQFADTSAVSIAYAIDAAAKASELSATEFKYVPFTSEEFQLSKEAQQSTAITSDRRPNGSKNTQGSASGSIGTEFGYAPFILDMLKLAVMGAWQEETAGGTSTGAMYARGRPQLLRGREAHQRGEERYQDQFPRALFR